VHGEGRCRYSNGNIYDGFWANGKIEGKGKMIFGSGDRYTGDFKDGRMSGRGEYVYADGDQYQVGRHARLAPPVAFVLIFSHYLLSKGEFKNDMRHGKGSMYFAPTGANERPERFDGDWRDGTMHGTGIYEYHDGSRYEGQVSAALSSCSGLEEREDCLPRLK
jgi:hypothetical protein